MQNNIENNYMLKTLQKNIKSNENLCKETSNQPQTETCQNVNKSKKLQKEACPKMKNSRKKCGKIQIYAKKKLKCLNTKK